MSALESTLAATFWACFCLTVYSYLGYALLIYVASRLFGRKAAPVVKESGDLPRLCVLVAAHNEEAVIEERVRNALATDYPRDRFEVVIASDGSSDRTAEIVRRYEGPAVRLVDYHERSGKAAVLNSAMRGVNAEIVLLSDANTYTDPDAARKLVRWFSDKSVGAVCGRLILTDAEGSRNADGIYWRYETFLKKCEGRLGALLGSNGAIYAIRRSLYVPIPNNTIVDDFVIPLLAKQNSGCEIVYDPEAVAREETAPNVGSEFHRRTRIGAGGFQAMALLWRLLDPRNGWIAFTFFSHKILRWCCPFFLIGMLACSVLLSGRPIYRGLLLAQAAFYTVSGLAALMPARVPLPSPVRIALMFSSMNLALLVGAWRWVRGNQKGTWKRTARAVEADRAVGQRPTLS